MQADSAAFSPHSGGSGRVDVSNRLDTRMNTTYDAEWDHDARGRGPWQRRLKVARLMARMHYYANVEANAPVVSAAGPVVSLTSYGSRIKTVHLTIESIARGLELPSRLILWLDDRQALLNLPRPLRRLQRRGLEILPTENFGPHKKYFPYVRSEDLGVPLVTADDDVLYPNWWLAGLVAAYRANPSCVHCYRAHVAKVHLDGTRFDPYANWSPCTSMSPSHLNFSTGCSGVLFPPIVLAALKASGSQFVGRCDSADDIWLNLHALRTGCPVAQITDVPIRFLGLLRTQRAGLFKANLFGGGNDRALAATFENTDLRRLAQLAAAAPERRGESLVHAEP
jgi:hypothetical protein